MVKLTSKFLFMEEYKTYKLGDVVNILDNKRVPLSSMQRQQRKGIYPYYGAQGIIDYIDDYLFDGEYLLIAEDGENLKSKKQNIAQIAKGKYWVNNHAHIVESNGLCDIQYVCYLLNLMDLSGYITGSAQPKLNQENLQKIGIRLPLLEKQHRIAQLLNRFDSKIELNRQINENLEQQAQALFKSWFVDFEPFKDGKFVDSELGKIPEGWKVVETNKFMTILKGNVTPTKNPNRLYAHYSIPAFDEKHQPIFQYGNEIKSNKQKISDNITLVSKLNPRIKRIWFIDEAYENAICSTEFIPYQSLNNSPYFLYCYLDSDIFYNSIMSLVNGATGSHQRFQAKNTLNFLFPYNATVISKFNSIVSGILKYKSRLIKESQNLSQLRDILIPRLMSGELTISDVRKKPLP